MKQWHEPAVALGAGGVYPYTTALATWAARQSKFGDDYNLARVVSQGEHQRIWLPRNMVAEYKTDLRTSGLSFSFDSKFVPKNPEQSRVVAESVALLEAGESHVCEAPTGFGKTIVAMEIIAQVGRKAIIVVTKEDVRDQWIEAAEKVLGLSLGNGIGLIQGDTFSIAKQPIVIAMIQSLAKEQRYNEAAFKSFGLAIWDEVHRVGADHFCQSCWRIPARLRLGLSATPDRRDGKFEVVRAHIGKTKVKSNAVNMVPRVISRKSPWIIPMVSRQDSNGRAQVVELPHQPGRCAHVTKLLTTSHPRNILLVNFIVAAYQKGRHVLIQSDFKEHLATIRSICATKGIPQTAFGYYVGGLTKAQREEAKTKQLILATYQMTAEATNIPRLDTLVLCTPKSDVRQIVGRILRMHEDKAEPVVFDVRDLSSSVFRRYWGSRRKWYASIGAEVDAD